MATTETGVEVELPSMPPSIHSQDPHHARSISALPQADPSQSIHLEPLSRSLSAAEAFPQADLITDLTTDLLPDGWPVLIGCTILTWWFIGTTYNWGIVSANLLNQNAKNAAFTPASITFVGSLTVTCIAVLGLINARLVGWMGARRAALLSMSLFGGGGVLGGWVTEDLGGLFTVVGGIMGVGTSIAFMVVSTTPGQYFVKHRGLANGIVYAGGGAGGAAISFLMDALLHRFGAAWTLRIIGILTLVTGLPAAWMVKDRVPRVRRTLVDWSLLRDPRFLFLFVTGTIGTFPLFVPPFFLPLYASSMGLSASTGAALVAGFNLASAAGRIGCGLLCDSFGPVNTLILTLLATGLSMVVLWPVASGLPALAAFVVIRGAANGGFFSTMPTVVGGVFGGVEGRSVVAMGMVVTGWVGGYLMGAPIAGYLLDAYGGGTAVTSSIAAYRPAIYYGGSMALGATGFAVLARMSISTKLWKKV